MSQLPAKQMLWEGPPNWDLSEAEYEMQPEAQVAGKSCIHFYLPG